jgi:PAS domain S-box-containing protein
MDDAPLSPGEYQAIAEQAPILIWRSDRTGGCNYLNERWLRFTGRSFDQERGSGWTEGVHPEDQKECLKTFFEAFERRQKFQMKYRLRRHDGIYRWVSDCGVPFSNEAQEFMGYVGSCIDITDNVELTALLLKIQGTELKTLRGLLPICANCKRIRDEKGHWSRIEVYIRERSEADFSHGICPDCAEVLYPGNNFLNK